jgi:hypothetical protein
MSLVWSSTGDRVTGVCLTPQSRLVSIFERTKRLGLTMYHHIFSLVVKFCSRLGRSMMTATSSGSHRRVKVIHVFLKRTGNMMEDGGKQK